MTNKLIIIDGSTSQVKCHMPVEEFLEQVVIKDATETVKGIVELNTGVDSPDCYTNNTDAVTALGMTRILSANPESPQMLAVRKIIGDELNPCGAGTRTMDGLLAAGTPVDWAAAAAQYSAAGKPMPPGSRVIAGGHTYRLIGVNWQSDPTTDGGINWLDETPLAADDKAGFVALNTGSRTDDDVDNEDALTAAGLTRLLANSPATSPLRESVSGAASAGLVAAIKAPAPNPLAESIAAAVVANSSNPSTATPPANPKPGQVWRASAGAAAPYFKNATYEYDGVTWKYMGGAQALTLDWTTPGYPGTAGGYHLMQMGSATLPVGNSLNANITADRLVLPAAGTYMFTTNYMGREEWTGRAPFDIVGSRLRLVLNSAQRGWSGTLQPATVADFGVWTGHSVSEVIYVEAGTEVISELEKTYSHHLSGGLWRVNIQPLA
ncbi:MAG: hypothetical protein BWK73_20245 [Thiothrix lacustris]|uniref:Uncharacterized protein n=1 Tax=Thiothrix lacustris TaxID=525917 RepID=A0A1Y1QP73_9GAMM|nr:MAG: hypothetical protein BWK73_20245 [Thiothrix lacustris]